jgi:hypothetical protein
MKGYQNLQEECAEESDRLSTQIATLTQRIQEQKEELADLQEQRKRTQSKTVRVMLDEQIETLGLAIDEMDERLTVLQEEALAQPYTNEHIRQAVAELAEHRKVN